MLLAGKSALKSKTGKRKVSEEILSFTFLNVAHSIQDAFGSSSMKIGSGFFVRWAISGSLQERIRCINVSGAKVAVDALDSGAAVDQSEWPRDDHDEMTPFNL